MLFGLSSLLASIEGRHVDSAWLIAYAVLADRLDGFLARLLRGTSELGVQMDSLADFLNFGVAPAVLFFTSLSTRESAFASDSGRFVLLIACGAWVLSAMFRLARFNVGQDLANESDDRFYFGVPTTLVAGLMIMWFLALLKYTSPSSAMAPTEPFGGVKLFGEAFTTPSSVWRWIPALMGLGAILMVSNMPIPKLGSMRNKPFAAFVLTNVAIGYVFGAMRIFPEFMIWAPSVWFVLFMLAAFISKAARQAKPPPLFPN